MLRVAEAKLDADALFTAMGMDSLIGLELRNRIEAALGIVVPATILWTYTNIVRLSDYLAGEIGPRAAAAPAPARSAEAPIDATAEAVTRMDDDSLMAFVDSLIERANDDVTP